MNLAGSGITFTATDSVGGITGTSSTFTINFLTFTQLAFGTQPVNGTAGSSMTSFTVILQDTYGNTVTSNSTLTTLSLSSGSIASGSTATPSSGVATFNATQINVANTGYTLTASAGGYTTSNSNSFNIVAGAASKLTWASQPSNTTAALAIPSFGVQITDANGNSTNTNNVTITLSPNSSSFASGNTAVTNSSGLATFGSAILNTAAAYTLTASGTYTTTVASSSFTVAAATATKLAFVSSPATTVNAGACTNYVVNSQDPNSNNSSVTSHTLTLSDGGAGGGFYTVAGCGSGGTSTVTLNGAYSSTFYYKNTTATSETLTVTDSGSLTAATLGLTVNPFTATKVVFAVQPTSGTAGTALTSFRVQLQDTYGNNVTTTGTTISLAIGTNPGTSTLSGTTSTTTSGGLINFTTVSLNKSGTGYTLVASSSGLTSATSNTFNITAGTATKLAFVASPSSVVAGTTLGSSNIQVNVLDANSNIVTTATNALTFSLSTNPGSATLNGTLTQNAVAGVATFNDISINTAATGYVIQAAGTSLTSATTSAFNITVGAADANQTTMTSTGPILANGTLTSTVTVTLKDAYGNAISGNTPVLTSSGSGNTIGACGSTNASGVTTCTLKSTKEEAKTLTLTVSSVVVAINPAPSTVQFYGVTYCEGGICTSASPTESNNVYAWGTVSANTTLTMSMMNKSSNAVTLGASLFNISGTDAALYAIQADNCSGQTLAANASCTVQVNFLATNGVSTQTYNASLDYTLPGSTLLSRALSGTRQ